jgi:hypothetical protein
MGENTLQPGTLMANLVTNSIMVTWNSKVASARIVPILPLFPYLFLSS